LSCTWKIYGELPNLFPPKQERYNVLLLQDENLLIDTAYCITFVDSCSRFCTTVEITIALLILMPRMLLILAVLLTDY
jgi:hypothetical protein